ncbi:MAG: lactate 2-monooxygenase [Bacteroidia bacterium]|nr:lactate 2-monooxygenase [Bacteroidia bacterium]
MTPKDYSSDSSSAVNRQREIYLNGAAGFKPTIPVNIDLLEAAAAKKMSREAFAYVAGGAGIGSTIKANRSGFDAWRIVPRMLRDVSVRHTETEILGTKMPFPLLLSPVGVLELAHPEADLAVAAAASETGVPYIFSNQASVAMEKTAAVMGNSPRWFQLYWSKSDALVESFVRRAEACGCSAIVVTLDTTMLGWRAEDLDLAYLPFLRGKGIAQYTSDPVFRQLALQPEEGPAPPRKITLSSLSLLLELTRNFPGNFWQNLRSGFPLASVRKFISIYSRPSLTWENLSFLREKTRLPIILKGILHPDDARKAVDEGINGLIVSNHGGRQVDGSIGSVEVLPGIVAAVGGKIPILLDSGIRGGADMFKALALGANAVCIGRPYVYALALAGKTGVQEVIRNFGADFELTMGLAGCTSLAEIDKNLLVKTEHSSL